MTDQDIIAYLEGLGWHRRPDLPLRYVSDSPSMRPMVYIRDLGGWIPGPRVWLADSSNPRRFYSLEELATLIGAESPGTYTAEHLAIFL